MIKVLRVGDPHITPDALKDGQALLDLVLKTAQEHKVDRIEFLGDQYHTHAIMHVFVMSFWQRNFKRLREAGFDVLCLVGNHDMPGDGSLDSAMLAHPDVIVIDKPKVLDGILYVPYTSTEETFLEVAALHESTVVCHQSFFGATYENGFPCEDGFDPGRLAAQLIISGHIHRPQELAFVRNYQDFPQGVLWYIGAPRWRTVSDANTKRAIWVMTHDDRGALIDSKAVDTGTVCKQIFHYEDTPARPLLLRPDDNSYVIDIKGPAAFIEQRKKLWTFARIRTFKTDTIAISVKESEGIAVAWNKYIEEFQAPCGTDTMTLKQMAKERLTTL